MGFWRTTFCGQKIESVTDEVRNELIPGEQILHAVEQARIMQPISPDSIYITTERVMFRGPVWFGLWSKNRDYRYEDMGNITVRKGLFNSSIHVKMRLLTYDICLTGIPNEYAPIIARTMQEGVDGRFEGIGRGSYSLPGSTDSPPPPTPGGMQRSYGDEDLLKILKYRYIKGEITKEEYDRMKKDIMS